jgi:uncharacterized transporter YbjL
MRVRVRLRLRLRLGLDMCCMHLCMVVDTMPLMVYSAPLSCRTMHVVRGCYTGLLQQNTNMAAVIEADRMSDCRLLASALAAWSVQSLSHHYTIQTRHRAVDALLAQRQVALCACYLLHWRRLVSERVGSGSVRVRDRFREKE